MTAEQIRDEVSSESSKISSYYEEARIRLVTYDILGEIAAQLAELNAQVSYLVPRPIIRKVE